jgi:hypothetical protein
MKTQIFTLVFLAGIFSAQAQNQYGQNYNQYNQSSVLTISTYNQAVISVLIDDEIQSNAGTSVRINFSTSGSHYLYITKQVPKGRRGYYTEDVFDGYVTVLAGSQMNGVIDEWGQIKLTQVYNNQSSNGGYRKPNRKPNGGNRNGSCGNGGNNGNGGGYTNGGNGGYNGNQNYNYFMTSDQFNFLKQTISSKSFDSSKEQVAMQAISTNNLSAAQVADMLSLFTFESTKLSVAKAAFLKSKDRANFYQVNNSFTFSSSISELGDFIAANS